MATSTQMLSADVITLYVPVATPRFELVTVLMVT